jgi:hypothetical protein
MRDSYALAATRRRRSRYSDRPECPRVGRSAELPRVWNRVTSTEGAGFEPARAFRPAGFQDRCISHSASPPNLPLSCKLPQNEIGLVAGAATSRSG